MCIETTAKGGPALIGIPDKDLEEELVRRIVARVKKEREVLKPNSKWWALKRISGEMDKLTTEMRRMAHERIGEE